MRYIRLNLELQRGKDINLNKAQTGFSHNWKSVVVDYINVSIPQHIPFPANGPELTEEQ